EASGKTGRARVLGGFRQRVFPPDVAVTVHDDAGTRSFAAVLTKPVPDIEPLHNSTTVCRIDAEEPLAVGQYAVLDLPAADVAGGAGDLHNTFSNEAERYLRVARERLAERGIPSQRALLVGGTCEASSFVRLGWIATGIALPNVNYHNAAPDGGFAPEIVRL